jgi:hypothetical protein
MPIFNVFKKGRTVDPIGTIDARTKEEAERYSDHIVGPSDVDLDRPHVNTPRGNRQGVLLEDQCNKRH